MHGQRDSTRAQRQNADTIDRLWHGDRFGRREQTAAFDLRTQLPQISLSLFIADRCVNLGITMREQTRDIAREFRRAKLLQQRAHVRFIRRTNRHTNDRLQQAQRMWRIHRIGELRVNQIHRELWPTKDAPGACQDALRCGVAARRCGHWRTPARAGHPARTRRLAIAVDLHFNRLRFHRRQQRMRRDINVAFKHFCQRFTHHRCAHQLKMQARSRSPRSLRFGAIAGVPRIQFTNPVFRQRQRFSDALFKRLTPELTHIAVRVMLRRQEQKAHLLTVTQGRQSVLQRAPCSALPGGVTIKTKHHLIGRTQQPLRMCLSRRRAERGDHVFDAVLRQRDDIHVALDDQHAIHLADRGLRLKQAV